MSHSQKGSEWRRWDLHLHTPETKLNDAYGNETDAWDRYINVLENSPVQGFGITDYFSADGYFKLVERYRTKYPNTEKVFFPNIEFRLYESISADHSNPHIHVIFSNDEGVCPKEKIGKFLSSLETYQEDDQGVVIKCSDLQSTSQYEEATVSLKNIKKALEETFGKAKPYLIAFPAKNDGVRSTDPNSPRKVLITDQIDKDSNLFFGGSDSQKYFLSKMRYEAGESSPKPVVSSSDAHSFEDLERLEGNEAGFLPTWIKADLTFRGLKQICFEPADRVFIGYVTLVEQRKTNQATKFLSRLEINQKEGYSGSNGQWFKDVSIPINPELTVIIGNKGSGKSAIVDIIGLLGDSRQHDYFSFLTDKGNNKKFKQRGYAENFEATLKWESGGQASKYLDAQIDSAKPESVRYLPQNYFEQLTNEIEIEEFRREIEDVVFSHVTETERMGKSTFYDLQEFKTHQDKNETSTLKERLRELNAQIINLEDQSDPKHKQKLEEVLKVKERELKSLEEAKPKEVSKPDEEDDSQKETSTKIRKHVEIQDSMKEKGQNIVEVISRQKARLQELTSLLQKLVSIDASIKGQKEELKVTCQNLGFNIDEILQAKINLSPIEGDIENIKKSIEKLEADNSQEFSELFDFSALESHKDLRAAYKYIGSAIDNLKEKLGAPQRKYQNYLEKLSTWNSSKKKIIGGDQDPQPDTINKLKEEISYIDNDLGNMLSEKLILRKEVAEKIFQSKKNILNFYVDIKKSVDEKLSSVKTDEFSVDIDASFVLNHSFFEDFLNRINKTRKGPFHGANDPEKAIKSIVGEADWNDFASIYLCLENIFKLMINYRGETLRVSDQANDKKEFYDFIFSLEYLSARYELRSGGKNLNELSPGEKGLLLLVFYLQLDKDNIPLIIDQPEDNLDNDSIFAVLAECIRQAKRNRQVVLVTHNPNLAVGADAEQVVFVQLDKSNNYKFSYKSGAIECPKINEKIALILEGSQPAFIKRRLKYEI